MKSTILLNLAVLLIVTMPVSAEIRTVPGEYANIQDAIDASSDGDVVVVEPGSYPCSINFNGKNIILTSFDPNDPEIVASTILMPTQQGRGAGDGLGSVVTFQSGETSDAILTGFTITGGAGTVVEDFEDDALWGAGVFCINSSPTIKGNVIADNVSPTTATGYGGGIACFNSSAIITNNIIRDNKALVGGGVLVYIGNAMIMNNLIYDNTGYLGGGVILIGGNLFNNTIAGNDASYIMEGTGGNLYILAEPELGNSHIKNNIICLAKSGGGVYWEGDFDFSNFAYNNVWANELGNYVDSEENRDGSIDHTGENGNISKDPLFANPEQSNYHLQSDSPCISAGDPDYIPERGETDIDGESRIYALLVDMGADEFVGHIKPFANAGTDQYLDVIKLVILDGTGSIGYDPCDVLAYQWTQIDGPGVQLSDTSSAQPTFMPEIEEEYRFELIVSDGVKYSYPDEVLIVVGNRSPVAIAGENKVLQVPGRIILDGSNSYDPDLADELAYTWTQVEGPTIDLEDANTATASFYCDQEGLFVFELVLNDGLVDSEPDLVEVTTVGVTMHQVDFDVASSNSNYYHYPDVSGSKVVYGAGSACDFTWDIYYQNMDTGENKSFGAGGLDTQPKVDGNIVVWFGGIGWGSPWYHEPSNTSVIARNIATNTQRVLRSYSMSESYSHPVVSGNKVVWLEHLGLDTSPIGSNEAYYWWNTPYNICGADITDMDNPVYFTIAENVGERDPYPCHSYSSDFDDVIDICGNIVVYEANGDIYGADISNIDNIIVFTICSDPSRQFDPAISGNIVVWTDQRNDTGDIYGADIFDVENIRELEIIKASGSQQQPVIDNYMIVYVDGSSEGGQIKACYLTKQNGTLDIEISGSPYGTGPVIDNGTIIWQTSLYGQVQGLSLEFVYSVFDGPIQNLTTGKYYEYVQHAINDSRDGDVIEVGPGLYSENVLFENKNVKVRSIEPNNLHIVADTIITGGNYGAIVTFSGFGEAYSELAGFTITGGSKGIYCNYASPAITNCSITGNLDAGIYLYRRSSPKISFCDISANGGSGIEMLPYISGRLKYYNHPEINNCVIAANQQYGIDGDFSTILNCTICDNLQSGIHNSTATITNSIIYFNGDGTIDAQISAESSTVIYSDVQGLGQNSGNMDADPLFADPLNGDYHLKSWAGRWDPVNQNWIQDGISSPCIDAGDPSSDTGSEPDPNGSVINMGAYGGTAQASKSR